MAKVIKLNKGIFCISIDLELAWGFVEHPTSQILKQAKELERPIIKKILSLLEKYEISASWAIVSGLLNRELAQTKPPPLEAWYAPDIIEEIKNANFKQEICSHSFQHIYYPLVDKSVAEADIIQAKEIHARFDLDFISFIFPKNLVGHLDLLAENGIKVFRSGASSERLARFGRMGRFLDKFIPIPPQKVFPLLHSNGLIELPSSILLIGRNGLRKLIPPIIYLEKVKQGIKLAQEHKSLFHLWFHPSNFYSRPEIQFYLLEKILSLISRYRSQNKIDAWPMKHFCEQIKQ